MGQWFSTCYDIAYRILFALLSGISVAFISQRGLNSPWSPYSDAFHGYWFIKTLATNGLRGMDSVEHRHSKNHVGFVAWRRRIIYFLGGQQRLLSCLMKFLYCFPRYNFCTNDTDRENCRQTISVFIGCHVWQKTPKWDREEDQGNWKCTKLIWFLTKSPSFWSKFNC